MKIHTYMGRRIYACILLLRERERERERERGSDANTHIYVKDIHMSYTYKSSRR